MKAKIVNLFIILISFTSISLMNFTVYAHSASRANEIDQVTKYTDEEILQVLLAGVGPISQEYPDLVTSYLGFYPDKGEVNMDELNKMIDGYLEFNKNFSSEISDSLRSGDPIVVENSLVKFSETFQEFLSIHYGFDADKAMTRAVASPREGAEVWVVAYAVAFVNAGVYANLGVATMALVAGAAVIVVVVAPGYLKSDDPKMPNSLESDATVNRISQFFRNI